MRVFSATLLCVVILGAGVGGFLLFGKPPEVAQNEDNTDLRPLVRTTSIEAHSLPVVIEMDGDANSFRVITLSSQVRGQIQHRSANARSGMFVHKGDLLFEIDSTNYELEIERLEAQLSQTDEEIRSVEVDIENTSELILLAEQDWELQKKQLKRVKDARERRSTSDSEVDSASRQEITARNALRTLQNSKRSQQQMIKQREASRKLVAAQLKQANVNLERCKVKAPITGRIVDDQAEEGTYVKDGDTLVNISDSSQIEVKCNLESNELVWILQKVIRTAESTETALDDPFSTPIPCEVVYDFEGSEVVWDGELSRFEGTGMDRNTRTFPCRVTVAEPSKYRVGDSQGGRVVAAPTLLSGMYVTVRVPISSSYELLRVPTEAVRPGGDVWVVRDGVLHIREVTVSRSTEDHALIRADETDMTASDEVVISPLVAAKDGMQVRVEEVQ